MANGSSLRSVASLLLLLNFCMYVVVLAIGGWAMNIAIDHGFIIGPELHLPAHFSPIYFPMGNAATGFFVTFSLIAGVVGVAFAWKQIELNIRNANLRTMEAFTIILTVTQLVYIAAIHGPPRMA
nr:membrane protein PM19L-like [Ipomoea batatas]